MEPSFWHDRWQEGRIGFHQGRPNDFLAKHFARLGEKSRVFVPLCGKAEDLAFLASHGHDVVGIDLVESAIRDFFREHDVDPIASNDDRFVTLRHGPFTLFAGDFFDLRPADLEGATVAYDRAAIVALPPDLRARYAAHIRTLLPERASILTVSFEFDPTRFEGPPFSVDEVELRRVYGAGATLELLDSAPIPQGGALWQAAIGAEEKCWLVVT